MAIRRSLDMFVFSLAYILTLCYPCLSKVTSCNKVSSCSCQSNEGLIDLSPLEKKDGARFSGYKDPSTANLYYWNPCLPFTEGTCAGVAACLQTANIPPYHSLGMQNSAQFSVDANGLHVIYAGGQFQSMVNLVCDPSKVPGDLTVQGKVIGGPGYVMTLTSRHACPIRGGGLSVGSVLVIILFVCVVIYIVGGLSVQKFARKAEGREIVPNVSFWTGLPGLIRDGALFTVSLCGRRGGKSYENI